MNGVIIVDKESNMTSRDVVNKIGKIYGMKKVGHTGTLDPLATGVLVICIGEATKIAELITSYNKKYIATFKFGVLTDTLDIEGNVIENEKKLISKDAIISILASMIGTYMQEVPIYSAVKVNGMKLYEYARNNIKVELPKHEVTIKSLKLLNIYDDDGHTNIEVECDVSKGTYIRSLGEDIAKKLNTHAIMTSLRRIKQGDFEIENSYKLEDIKSNTKLLTIKECLKKYYIVEVSENLKNDILNGKILDNSYNKNEILFTYNNEAIALYKVYDKDKNKIKPWKMFMKKV